jgi:hypothetical protein
VFVLNPSPACLGGLFSVSSREGECCVSTIISLLVGVDKGAELSIAAADAIAEYALPAVLKTGGSGLEDGDSSLDANFLAGCKF